MGFDGSSLARSGLLPVPQSRREVRKAEHGAWLMWVGMARISGVLTVVNAPISLRQAGSWHPERKSDKLHESSHEVLRVRRVLCGNG